MARHGTRERGQVLALVALMIVVLLGMASVAIDVGRLLTQKRFIQNAADAAALAAADSVIQNATNPSATVATAKQAAKNILAIDLAGSPVGAPLFTAADPPVFNGTYVAQNLVDGIVLADASGNPLPDTSSLDPVADIRVALKSSVDFTFGRVVGVNSGTVTAHARAGFGGSLMPIAVRRYLDPPGPDSPTPNPCPDPLTVNEFADLAATQATTCLGQVDQTSPIGYDARTPASPASPGPIIQLVGQGADAVNGASFRGFIVLDIRNFQDQYSRLYYNGVTSGTQPNVLKNIEAGWVATGYPGPGFPPITSPPDPNDQVGVMDGNSAGIVVTAISNRFKVGNVILCALYDGTVMAIPDFFINPPSSLPGSGGLVAGAAPLANGGTFSVKRNQAFTSTVTLSTVGAPSWLSLAYSPNPVTTIPLGNGTTVTMTSVTAAAGTVSQVDTFWIKGQAGSPYLTTKYVPVPVVVGTVSKDFSWSLPSATGPATWGDQVTYTVTLSAKSLTNFTNSNSVHVTLDGSGAVYPAWPAGSYWFNGVQGQTSADVAMGTKSGNMYQGTFTITINTSLLGAQATYNVPLLMTATNTDSQSVKHQDRLTVLASASAGSDSYVDIIGFAAYRITGIDANTVWGQAISTVKASAGDPALRAALTPRLIAW